MVGQIFAIRKSSCKVDDVDDDIHDEDTFVTSAAAVEVPQAVNPVPAQVQGEVGRSSRNWRGRAEF